MKKSTLLNKDRSLYRIEFSFFDIFSHIKRLFCYFALCKCKKDDEKKYLSHSEFIYLHAFEMVEEELNIYHELKSMKKLKAAASFLLQNEHNVSNVKRTFVD